MPMVLLLFKKKIFNLRSISKEKFEVGCVFSLGSFLIVIFLT